MTVLVNRNARRSHAYRLETKKVFKFLPYGGVMSSQHSAWAAWTLADLCNMHDLLLYFQDGHQHGSSAAFAKL